VPYEGTQTQAPSFHPTVPPTPSKPIVGAEKVGVGIPVPEEHLFERKLRKIARPETTPKKLQEIHAVSESSTEASQETEVQRKPLIKTPSYGVDPYREPME